MQSAYCLLLLMERKDEKISNNLHFCGYVLFWPSMDPVPYWHGVDRRTYGEIESPMGNRGDLEEQP